MASIVECNGNCGFCSSLDSSCHDDMSESWIAKMDFAAGVSNLYISDSSGLSNQLTYSTDAPY